MIVRPRIKGFICTTAHPDANPRLPTTQFLTAHSRGPATSCLRKEIPRVLVPHCYFKTIDFIQ